MKVAITECLNNKNNMHVCNCSYIYMCVFLWMCIYIVSGRSKRNWYYVVHYFMFHNQVIFDKTDIPSEFI